MINTPILKSFLVSAINTDNKDKDKSIIEDQEEGLKDMQHEIEAGVRPQGDPYVELKQKNERLESDNEFLLRLLINAARVIDDYGLDQLNLSREIARNLKNRRMTE